MLPAILRLCGETRSPDELFRAGEISADAQWIARVLGVADDALSTSELRRQAGFPTGKPQRAAYLKAVDELDTRLLLAKVFSAAEGDIEMRHALVRVRYPDAVAAAAGLTREAALDTFLAAYMPLAVLHRARGAGEGSAAARGGAVRRPRPPDRCGPGYGAGATGPERRLLPPV